MRHLLSTSQYDDDREESLGEEALALVVGSVAAALELTCIVATRAKRVYQAALGRDEQPRI